MSRVAGKIDAVFSAGRERKHAARYAAPSFADHCGSNARLTGLAAAAAIKLIRARVDATAAARPGLARTGEGAAAIHTYRR
jgi:hypothetical protein